MKNIEEKMVEINSKLPQLPENTKAFLANIFWILAIISVVFNVWGILTVLGIGTFGSMFLAGLGTFSLNLWITILFGALGMGITVIMELTAIKPLKDKKYRGWHISFCVVLLQLVFSVIYDIFSGSFSGILITIITLAISLYLLMQVREYFSAE